MNVNVIIAILETKGIITREEGEKVVEFINNKPQPTLLADAVDQVKELVSELAPILTDVERTAKAAAKKVTTKAVADIETVKEEVKQEAKTGAELIAEEVARAAEAAGGKQSTDTTDKK
jgi:ElaB/YqjD/DUF883 family membrane-anchored ribosome-binding protein